MQTGKHTFTLHYGCMGSSKTFSLIRSLKTISYDFPDQVIAFRPYFPKDPQSQKNARQLRSREKNLTFPSIPIPADKPEIILENIEKHVIEKKLTGWSKLKLLGFDEIQFYPSKIIELIQSLLIHSDVEAAGLNTDYLNRPFGPMPDLICMADISIQCFGFCSVAECENLSVKTFRNPKAGNSQIVEGDIEENLYFPMCKKHYAYARNNSLEKLTIKRVSLKN